MIGRTKIGPAARNYISLVSKTISHELNVRGKGELTAQELPNINSLEYPDKSSAKAQI